MFIAILIAFLRALVVWIATMVAVWLPSRALNDGALILLVLGMFYTVPAMALLVLLHLIEGKLLRSTLPVMSLSLGLFLITLGWLLNKGPIAELAWPMGTLWFITGFIRALVYRPAPSWP
jgi:hypothetical protein